MIYQVLRIKMVFDLISYATTGNHQKLKLLLDDGVSVDAMNTNKESSLLFAAKQGNLQVVKLLLSYGADPNLYVT